MDTHELNLVCSDTAQHRQTSQQAHSNLHAPSATCRYVCDLTIRSSSLLPSFVRVACDLDTRLSVI